MQNNNKMILVLKKEILNKINFIMRLYFNFLFRAHRNYAKLVVFDIDNTLTIFDGKKSKRELIKNPRLNTATVNLLGSYKDSGVKVILLSAREIHFYFETLNWATKNKLISRVNDLILVPKPQDKIDFLKRAIAKNKLVLYYDDLSYNHEHGEVKLYEDVINEVKQLKITYFGLQELNKESELNDTNEYI